MEELKQAIQQLDDNEAEIEKTSNQNLDEEMFIVWSLLLCSFSDFPKLVQRKSVENYSKRFLEIKADDLISRKIGRELFTYRSPPWSALETMNLSRLHQLNSRRISPNFLEDFPTLFNPTRNKAAILAAVSRLKHGNTATKQFKEWVSSVQQDAHAIGVPSIPKKKQQAEQIQKLLKEEETSQLQEHCSYETLRSRCNFSSNTFAVLLGTNSEIQYKIKKAHVIVGRSSLKENPDIDLKDCGLMTISRRHLEINLATDLNFYLHPLKGFVIINGAVFKDDQRIQLKDRDVLDIGGELFMFFENQEMMSKLRSA